MDTYSWYGQLIKPSFAPPSWIFGPVWTVLYLIIIVSFGYVFRQAWAGKIPKAVLIPVILNVIFNLAFTPLQFSLKNNLLAAVDITLVLASIIWIFISVWPYYRWVVYANLPYLFWVGFATILQLTITYLNR